MSRGSSSFPRVEVRSRAELRQWLKTHHRQSGSIWLVTYKKSVPARYVPYSIIVDEALCFGWIDSLPRSLDAKRSMRLLSPRKPKSGWSRRNKTRALALLKAGRMHRSGRETIARAQADGSWSKLDRVETLAVPWDLRRALDSLPRARANFAAFPPSSRRLILEWIAQAKRPETRASRVRETAEQAAKGVRAHHYRQPKTVKGASR